MHITSLRSRRNLYAPELAPTDGFEPSSPRCRGALTCHTKLCYVGFEWWTPGTFAPFARRWCRPWVPPPVLPLFRRAHSLDLLGLLITAAWGEIALSNTHIFLAHGRQFRNWGSSVDLNTT